MGGRIDCYLDIVSYYSYLAFLDLVKNREALASHSVEVEFHPVLLGGINKGSGNKPPWTLPAKAVYGAYDAKRAIDRFPGLKISFPKDLMAVAHSVVPLRALHFIKVTYPQQTFETTLHYLMYRFWSAPNLDLSKAENVVKSLSEIPANFRGYLDGDIASTVRQPITAENSSSKPLFSPAEIQKIMQATSESEFKDRLKDKTQEALDKGAFGAPWMWVTNSQGKGEPFFGSDRFDFIYRYLDLPVQRLALLPAKNEAKL
ncbi:glutathione S-transferase kappa 1 [Rhypophila decipiens]|uniref:Glutathione S-transferase kappa 1 n=1 Tax=Rhypophila decipiens TaxID=261697 RepID=A0AAN6YEQ8_9PEZI|nr:glutathione S-transferase kappa 1 [Rhypophila decipiens]